jgi:hypothetical protein
LTVAGRQHNLQFGVCNASPSQQQDCGEAAGQEEIRSSTASKTAKPQNRKTAKPQNRKTAVTE